MSYDILFNGTRLWHTLFSLLIFLLAVSVSRRIIPVNQDLKYGLSVQRAELNKSFYVP